MESCSNNKMRKDQYRNRLVSEYLALKTKINRDEEVETFNCEMDRFLDDIQDLINDHIPGLQEQTRCVC